MKEESPSVLSTSAMPSPEELIRKKLEALPHEQLKKLINDQLDLEIRIKHKELNMAEDELSKTESQMLLLRKFLDIPNNDTSNDNNLTVKYYDLLSRSLNATYERFKEIPTSGSAAAPLSNVDPINPPPGHSYRTRSTTSSLRPTASTSVLRPSSVGCLYRRSDGVVVRLTCPDCLRYNFSSAQGFLNHSRIAHSKEYTSQDTAAIKCGEVLPDIPQDSVGQNSIKILQEKGLDPSKHLNVSEFLFTEDSATPQTDALQNFEFPKGDGKVPEGKASNRAPSSNELLKKLVKEGKMEPSEYEKLVLETRKPVSDAHLFDDEVESNESGSPISEAPSASSVVNLGERKRRQSRGGINISSLSAEIASPTKHQEAGGGGDVDGSSKEEEEEEEEEPVEKKGRM
ncbi:hypothetical protein KGF57_001558 [Candida theae]|uniref:AHC1-like C2H2 zinc-finger domain-containing protein n=1 Tax=Candida theae TaxID=1198502 RepID=A0AAD5BGY8_9ASCO|nr:uncharacterized protein KGF57_001558 [Candida theae]KAI5961930.1 hypothetical protein KGF57_001558 [Candida theae]